MKGIRPPAGAVRPCRRGLAVALEQQFDDAALGLDADLLLDRQALVEDEAGEAAGTVAALFDLGAIGVEDAIAKVHVRVLGVSTISS